VESEIHPIVEIVSSILRTISGSSKGLKKKKLGKVITISQKTMKIETASNLKM
jgi:hypothetical protein